MPTWNPNQYLRFARQRTRPGHDLAERIEVERPQRVIDLGCGPGNSTHVLAERWPAAGIMGIDTNAAMIEAARQAYPTQTWAIGDIAHWTAEEGEQFDVVFSNAALQWVKDHARLFPLLLARVAPGGALAVQMPANGDAPAHQAMRDQAASEPWRGFFPAEGARQWHAHATGFYYDLLSPQAARIDLWETTYLHVLPDAAAIVEWYKGTGLRPFLDFLASEADRARFLAEYGQRIRQAYPARPDGRVLFPFRRLFLIAYQRKFE
jgi:trans-aconitate 2-methyltransferase